MFKGEVVAYLSAGNEAHWRSAQNWRYANHFARAQLCWTVSLSPPIFYLSFLDHTLNKNKLPRCWISEAPFCVCPALLNYIHTYVSFPSYLLSFLPRSLVSYTSMHCKKMFKFLFISIFLTRTLPFSIRFWKNSLFLKILENTFWTVYRAPPSLETNIGDGNRFADMFYIYINIYTANCFCLIVHW